MKKLFLATLLVFLLPMLAMGATLRVSWDPNTEEDLAGYRVYYKAASELTFTMVDVGNVTTADINGVLENIEYCAYVTAYDTSNNESEASVTVCAIIDTQAPDKPKGIKAIILKLFAWARSIFG
ncbi:MAG TPA: fibronectin type III domain-containing protein [Deltaproteobacteria bacterium]|nr:fibronectin type III domain-containing protein [Deltaproteobacteria bacterium]HNS91011.1 fibronectin type III domain-containing protein [Deltaproteobacteria bacterium]HPA76983.1 fibronectin type III domain-containing protein [Deltaproteobacteria bacterium]